MRLSIISILLSSSLALATGSATFHPSTATIYAWPLSAESPTPLAQISITSPLEAKVDTYTQPDPSSNAEEIIRIGLYDPSTKRWTGVATSASTLRSDLIKRFTLHLDEEGKVWNVGISAQARLDTGKTTKKKSGGTAGQEQEQIVIDLRPVKPGPAPILNKPIVLSSDGKVPQGEEKDERSFFQKYWWALALFLLLQVAAGGGGGGEK